MTRETKNLEEPESTARAGIEVDVKQMPVFLIMEEMSAHGAM